MCVYVCVNVNVCVQVCVCICKKSNSRTGNSCHASTLYFSLCVFVSRVKGEFGRGI